MNSRGKRNENKVRHYSVDTGRVLPCYLLLVVPHPMKVGDWVTWTNAWTNGTSAGQVTAFVKERDGGVTVHVQITSTHPNKLSDTVFTLPYPYEELTVVPEAIAKIINS